MIIDSLLQSTYDRLTSKGVSQKSTWAGRKLWEEHLIDIRKDAYTVYLDVLPDIQIGRSFDENKTLWSNNWGGQIGATLGEKLSFYATFTRKNIVFTDYVNQYIDEHHVIPGQQKVIDIVKPDGQYAWNDASAGVSYTANKYLNISLAYDKNFIGDGYRSLLLSDVSANYTALKLTGTLGNVQYISMWTYMRDPFASQAPNYNSDGLLQSYVNSHKWGVFQYLDWNVDNRLSVGFFQSILWAPNQESGKRGIDFNYINPLIFLRAVELTNTASPDKVHLGLNIRHKTLKTLSIYGQFLLSELTAKELFTGNGYIHNKFAVQLGVRGYDLFNVPRLNYLAEFNTARPYTYQHFTPITAYTNYNQPLAHMLGANFREGIAILNYGYRRFDFQLQTNWAMYGLDPDESTNYGGNIFKSYLNQVKVYGNTIGQGINTHLFYGNITASYLINPKYNLRLELNAANRKEWNEHIHSNTRWINIGIRSSFRKIYSDF